MMETIVPTKDIKEGRNEFLQLGTSNLRVSMSKSRARSRICVRSKSWSRSRNWNKNRTRSRSRSRNRNRSRYNAGEDSLAAEPAAVPVDLPSL